MLNNVNDSRSFLVCQYLGEIPSRLRKEGRQSGASILSSLDLCERVRCGIFPPDGYVMSADRILDMNQSGTLRALEFSVITNDPRLMPQTGSIWPGIKGDSYIYKI